MFDSVKGCPSTDPTPLFIVVVSRCCGGGEGGVMCFPLTLTLTLTMTLTLTLGVDLSSQTHQLEQRAQRWRAGGKLVQQLGNAPPL